MSIYKVKCVRIDSKDKFHFILDTDATDVGVIESQAASDALKQQAEVVSIEKAAAIMKENKEEPAVDQVSMSFAQKVEHVCEEIWNNRHPERQALAWEEEYLVQKMLSWLSEEDHFESLKKEADLIEEYALPIEWDDELKPMIKLLKESLSGLSEYINDEEDEINDEEDEINWKEYKAEMSRIYYEMQKTEGEERRIIWEYMKKLEKDNPLFHRLYIETDVD